MMANGKEANDGLSAGVRPRLKREYQFALRAQSEICGDSLGRTRSSRLLVGSFPALPPNKRSKVASSAAHRGPKRNEVFETEAKKDLVEIIGEVVESNEGTTNHVPEDGGSCLGGTPAPSDSTLLNDNSKEKPFRRFTRSALKEQVVIETESVENGNVATIETVKSEDSTLQIVAVSDAKNNEKKFVLRLKALLESGLLEGTTVKYCRGSKAIASGGMEYLKGVISGSEILCFCRTCSGKIAVSPTVFELHAGSLNKRPAEFIYLENGNSLRDVINSWKAAPLGVMEEALRVSIGVSCLKKPHFCLNCKGSMDGLSSVVICESCLSANDQCVCFPETPCLNVKGNNENITALALPARVSKHSAPHVKKQGKVTRKDLRLHKLVFEDDILPDGTEVAYYANGKKLLVGYKKGCGIVCSCCNTEISPSQFEAHAGCASRRKPYLHIFTSNGVSLHELSVSLCKTRKISTVENDDLCQICQDGGSLICCDGCPRSFHKECLELPFVPEDEFYCKFCLNAHHLGAENSSNAKAAGRVDGVDFIEQITTRCIRIVKVPGADFGGCSICRDPDFEKGFGPRTIILCDQCEKEYHVGCLKEQNMEDMKELPTGKWFCCVDCNAIHSTLQRMIIHGEEKLSDSAVDVIRRKLARSSPERDAPVDVGWRILSGQRDPHDSDGFLSAAISIFHEQFSPIVHKRDCDLIPAMVKGGTLMEHDFSNMYCAVLLVNAAIVSAAIIRIYGPDVAELPLVATSSHCQGKGCFQVLFACIEKLLSSLNVKSLVLPAASEAESIWTNKFGFSKISHDELSEYRKFYDVMIFEGTSVLRKVVPKRNSLIG